ncbi:low density lipoprotein receptor adapter protein 1-A [Pristis pectinata]|uniref:low density lipoprotein receptor adapter protein 1-A n=1 Tax=Pristis pectinata TaxID=685728 RepID=UPI00223C9792|nr:low density lipoprotein receptor adapter protein 1-A [Pristis pectinata]
MALNNLPFIHTIKNSPAILRQRFQRDRAKSLSHGDPAFRVHYAGTQQIYSLEVEQASEAVRLLVGAEGTAKACKDHVLVVRPRYLEVKEIASGRQLTKTYLHDIAYCTADRAHPSVFLYICKHRKQLQCRVFRCNREEKARAITVCLAKVFEAAFSQWHASLGEGALPPLSPDTPSPAQGQAGALDAGTSRDEEVEGEPSRRQRRGAGAENGTGSSYAGATSFRARAAAGHRLRQRRGLDQRLTGAAAVHWRARR